MAGHGRSGGDAYHLAKIQDAIAAEDYDVTSHFIEELRADHFYFVDAEAAILEADEIEDDGLDAQGNPKFKVTGTSTDGRLAQIVCSLLSDGSVLLITVYEL